MTKIYKTYSDFLRRDDKSGNGVSQEFADLNPDYQQQNKPNSGCWNCSRCSGCSHCSDCSGCSGCSGCSRCSRCSDCFHKKDAKGNVQGESSFDVPILSNIHATILKAVSQPEALDMSNWHKCETTHCRGGWVVTLAGEKGKALEAVSSTLFAAMQIYKASSKIKVSPVRFFETNEAAMADVKRCAEEEAKL